jgi:hypothetical protein
MADAEKQRPTTYEKSLIRAFGLQSLEELDQLLAQPISQSAAERSGDPDEEYDLSDRMYEEEERQREAQRRSTDSLKSAATPANVQARPSRGTTRSVRKSIVNPFVAGVVAFLVSLVVLLIVVGPVTCSDGWHSPSIGRQGACSWHGCVDTTPQILVGVVSLFVGVLASELANRL